VECHTNTVKALDLSQTYLYLQEARQEGSVWRGRPVDAHGNLASMHPLRPLRANAYWAEGIKIDQPLKDWAKGLHDAGDADVATLSTMIEEEAQLAAAGEEKLRKQEIHAKKLENMQQQQAGHPRQPQPRDPVSDTIDASHPTVGLSCGGEGLCP